MCVYWKYALLASAASVLVFADDKNNERIVNTSQGPVKGFRDFEYDDVYAFHSIPYATAPTGRNKFKAPIAPPVWQETFEAVDKGIICPQHDMYGLISTLTMQEDCLLASVYVPDKVDNNLPVVVYVHGGAFQMGMANSIMPRNLVRSKKMIAVTFNYRLGVHGFLCLGTEDVPGNAGMKDQVALLRWVKKNIASFGGNPDDVTIAGYSAGSSSVDLLMLSESTRGLFNKVIPESGANLAVWSVQQQPLENAKMFAKQLNFTNVDDVYAIEEFYKTASLQQITSDSFMTRPDSTFVFSPCVERDTGVERFLHDAPINIIKSGKYPKVPLLYGFSNMEGLFRVQIGYESWKKFINEKFSDFLPADLEFENNVEREKVANEVKAFYFKGESIGDDTIHDFINYFTDVLFAYGTLRAVKLHVDGGHDKIYLYEFSYPHELEVPGSTPKITVSGANHCAQTAAVLDGAKYMSGYDDTTDDFQKVKKIMRELWTNFITTGTPVPASSSLPKWLPVSGRDCSPYMDLNLTSQLRGALLKERVEFWDRIYDKYYRVPTPPSAPLTKRN